MSTLQLAPRTATSITSAGIKAPILDVTIPPLTPWISGTPAMLHTFPSRPMDPKQDPMPTTQKNLTPRPANLPDTGQIAAT